MMKSSFLSIFILLAGTAGQAYAIPPVSSDEVQRQIVFESMLDNGAAVDVKDKRPERDPARAAAPAAVAPQQGTAEEIATPQPVPASPPPARPVRVAGASQEQAVQVAAAPTTAPPATPPVSDPRAMLDSRAKAGDAEAEYRMGMMHATDRPGTAPGGAGSQSYYWFNQAASKGHVRAQYNLGVMYAQGDGIVQNLVEAYIWFNLASAQKMEGAQEARDMVAASLTPSALMKAQERSTLYHQQIAGNIARMAAQGPSGFVPVQ